MADELPTPNEGDVAGELQHMADEPLLPVEKWLIGGSLLLGVVLLAILLLVSATLFPPGQ